MHTHVVVVHNVAAAVAAGNAHAVVVVAVHIGAAGVVVAEALQLYRYDGAAVYAVRFQMPLGVLVQ